MIAKCSDYFRSAALYWSVLLFLLLAWVASFQPDSSHAAKDNHQQNKPSALVYAGRQFHDEITSSMACLLHELGYSVTVYIYSGTVIGGISFPFPNRLHAIKAHYGRCVDNWMYITPHTNLVHDPNVIVFVTYPMKTERHTPDAAAYSLLKQVQSRNVSTKVVLVIHQAKQKMWDHATNIEKYVPRERLVFLFLSEHTHHTAQRLQQHTTVPYNLSFVYPALPLHKLFDKDRTVDFASHHSPYNRDQISFAIQGHFGGQHDKRRNVSATLACLHRLALSSGADSHTSPMRSQTFTLSLVGKGSAEHIINPSQAKYVKVHRSGELSSFRFYKEVANADFLITALGSDLYLHRQATSTIPTALILGVPLVTTRALLELYPCLRDAPMHVRLAQHTECESVQQAGSLSAEEYIVAQEEVRNCSRLVWEEAQQTMRHILQT